MAEDDEDTVGDGPNHVILFWRDANREPMKFACIGYSLEGGFAIFDVRWFDGNKTLVYPADLIHSIEVMDEEAVESTTGYSESNEFREQPGISPWFPAVKPNG